MTKASSKPVFAFVGRMNANPVRYDSSVREKYDLLLIHSNAYPTEEQQESYKKFFTYIEYCDFSPASIQRIIDRYHHLLVGVTSRTEYRLDEFIAFVTRLPSSVLAPSARSLQCANNKKLMKEAFSAYDPDLSPRHVLVDINDDEHYAEVCDKLRFPVILKPTNLAGSVFIRTVADPADLSGALTQLWQEMQENKHLLKREPDSTIMVEEFEKGETYTLDAYVDAAGEVTTCPLVRMISADEDGGDGFHSRRTITPVDLSPAEKEGAARVARDAIRAVGLTTSTVQLDLIRTPQRWKVIEVGARMGSYRRKQYRLAYQFDHSVNDIAIRLGKEPRVTTEPQGYCVSVKFFAETAGICKAIRGVEELQDLSSLHSLRVKIADGDIVRPPGLGGSTVAQLMLFHHDRDRVLADSARAGELFQLEIIGQDTEHSWDSVVHAAESIPAVAG